VRFRKGGFSDCEWSLGALRNTKAFEKFCFGRDCENYIILNLKKIVVFFDISFKNGFFLFLTEEEVIG